MPTKEIYQKNKEYYCKYTQKNKEKIKEYKRKYWLKTSRKAKEKYGVSLTTIRRYGLENTVNTFKKFKYKCYQCGEKEDLTIHHLDNKGINYIRKGLKANNLEDNLIILCRKCHGKLHNKQRWDKNN